MRVAALHDHFEELDLIKGALQAIGHDCHAFAKGSSLLCELRRDTFQLLILDWHPPDTTGSEIVRWIRSNLGHHMPILFVTSRHRERDIVEGLAAGADDFMVKPICTPELTARVQALLRRAYTAPRLDDQVWGRYRFVLESRQIEIDGIRVDLTQKEFVLALILFRNVGRVLSREYLRETVWSANPRPSERAMSRSLDNLVSRIRTALELRAGSGYRLVAVYGQGYRLDDIGANEDKQTRPAHQKSNLSANRQSQRDPE